jgi:hypothetical protein
VQLAVHGVWMSASRALDLAFEQLQLFLRDALLLAGLFDQRGGGLDLLSSASRFFSRSLRPLGKGGKMPAPPGSAGRSRRAQDAHGTWRVHGIGVNFSGMRKFICRGPSVLDPREFQVPVACRWPIAQGDADAGGEEVR